MRTVLIVEDDHDTRVALRDAFEENGYAVVTAANGADGFRIFRALSAPFVVVLDQNMPLMSGDDFLRQRLNYPDLLNIPVVVMSAVSDRSLALGANAFIGKPLNVEVLINTVSAFFDGGPSKPASLGNAGRAGEATATAGSGGKKSVLKFLGLGLRTAYA